MANFIAHRPEDYAAYELRTDVVTTDPNFPVQGVVYPNTRPLVVGEVRFELSDERVTVQYTMAPEIALTFAEALMEAAHATMVIALRERDARGQDGTKPIGQDLIFAQEAMDDGDAPDPDEDFREED